METCAHSILTIWITSSIHVPDFEKYIETYSYLGILIWFISFDNIMPVPQEISMMIIGYLAANGFFNPYIAALVGTTSLVIDDLIYFMLSRKGTKLMKRLKTGINSNFFKVLERKLHKKTFTTYAIICFIPRARFFGPVILGLTNMRAHLFALMDFGILLLFSAIYVGLGYFFYHSVLKLVEQIQNVHHIFFISLLLLITSLLLIFRNQMQNLWGQEKPS